MPKRTELRWETASRRFSPTGTPGRRRCGKPADPCPSQDKRKPPAGGQPAGASWKSRLHSGALVFVLLEGSYGMTVSGCAVFAPRLRAYILAARRVLPSAYPVPRLRPATDRPGWCPRDRKETTVSATAHLPARAKPAPGPGEPGTPELTRGRLGHPAAACPLNGRRLHGMEPRLAAVAGGTFRPVAVMTARQMIPGDSWPGTPAPGTGEGAVART